MTGAATPHGSWRAEARRERHGHVAQIAIVLVAAAVAITAVVLFGRAIADAGQERDRHTAHLAQLVDLGDRMRAAHAAFWRARARGTDPIASITQAAFFGRAAVGALAEQEADGPSATPAADTVRAMERLHAAFSSRPPGIVAGSAADRGRVARADSQFDRLRGSIQRWISSERRVGAAAAADAHTLSRNLLVILGALLAAVVAGAIGAHAVVARSGRRLLAAHVRTRDERDALLAALQDGLIAFDTTGRVEDVNRTFMRMTGLSRSDLVGTGPPFPFWPATSDEEGGARSFAALLDGSGGEVDAVYRRADGSSFHAVVSIAPRHGPGGRVDGHVATVKDVTDRRRAEADIGSLAAEQSALRTVATAVAASDDPVAAYAAGAREAARLVGVDRGVVVRLDAAGAAVVGSVGPWPDDVGTVLPPVGDGPAMRRVDPPAGTGGTLDTRWVVAAPILEDGRPWGALAVGGTSGEPPAGATHHVALIARILGLAVANATAREKLAALADGDPVTGLANHRAFHERLAGEVHRARRHGRPLSLALLDIDLFRNVNDAHGHQTGDRVLAETARRLREAARPGDLVARVGGEEFGIVMPETRADDARGEVERIRRAVAATPFAGVGHLTVSAGVCDLDDAHGAEELVRLADGALYYVKAHGRDAVCVYAPDVVQELSVAERAARLEHDHLLAGLRGLARAVDAKDRAMDATDGRTRSHSERVGALAEAIAREMGWPDDRVRLLREAALLHDVGKIGVRDAVLLKEGDLTRAEREAVMRHAELGAEMVAGILTEEQARWILHHHERVDGDGYPGGLRGRRIPTGAMILAIADAWDLMTAPRRCADGAGHNAALEECHRAAGSRFDARVVGALERVVASGRAAAVVAEHARGEREDVG